MSIETAFVSTLSSEMAHLQPVIDRYGLLALFVACMAEGFGVPLPGQTLLIACGLLAASGKLDMTSVLVFAWFSTQLGDIIGFAIGCYGLQRVLNKAVKQRDRLLKLDRLFDRWGIWLLVFARFLEGVRQTSNLAAGALAMSWSRFLVGTLVGTSLWVLAFGAGAYYLEHDFRSIVDWIVPVKPVAIAVTVALLATVALYLFGKQADRIDRQNADDAAKRSQS